MRRVVCTTATRRQLPQARALAWSLRTHDHAARLLVLLLDDRRSEVNPAAEPFAVARPADLDIARFELLAGMHAGPELELVVKPGFLRFAMDWASGPVLHLGVDALVLAPLKDIFALFAEHPLVLVPRLHAPVPRDHVRLTDEEIIKQGVFDPGCIGLRPAERVDSFLRAWSDRLEYDLGNETPLPAGRFLDLAPGFFEEARILIDPGLGVSRLNLHERRITNVGGRFEANGRPLSVVRFDGLDGAEEPHPDPYSGPLDGGPPSPEDRRRTPQAAREELQRALLDRHHWLSHLVSRRALLLGGCGADAASQVEYGYARLADGTALSRRLRRAVRDAELYAGLTAWPFSAAGTDHLIQWLNGPGERGARAGVTRYWFEIYRERPDLQVIHPDLDGAGGEGFVRWAFDSGLREYATPAALHPFGF